jgi:hypothetical protein
MSTLDALDDAIAEFEAEHGPIPRIETAQALYADFCRWSPRTGAPVIGLNGFIRTLARRGHLPVRLPDGTLGFLGIALKDSAHARADRVVL